MIDSIPVGEILNISPYNALGYGLAVGVLTWMLIYFKNVVAEKDKIIRDVLDKNNKAYDTISDKLTEIKNQNHLDKTTMIYDLTQIKKALEI